MHRDINPNNILVKMTPGGLRASVTDFGIASLLPPEGLGSGPGIEGTPIYIAPEQTGQTARRADFRCDLYSLGVTIYELLCGRPPFLGDSPAELIHAHVAALAPKITDVNPLVPNSVASVVMKLLEKEPEGRYQSGEGLAEDLRECRRRIRERDDETPFCPAMHASAHRFMLPSRVYGREPELGRLRSQFLEVMSGAFAAMAVAGPAGIGKTALMSAGLLQSTAQPFLFARGKFGESAIGTPMSGIIQILNDLSARILSGSYGSVNDWKTELTRVTSPNQAVITQLSPDWVHIFNDAEELGELPLEQADRRLLGTLEALFAALPAIGWPVVLFFDDLQWTDGLSARIIRNLVTELRPPRMFVLGAFRGSRGGSSDASDNLFANTINLAPVSDTALRELVSDFLGGSSRIEPDAVDRMLALGAGNPLFVRTALRSLVRSSEIAIPPDVTMLHASSANDLSSAVRALLSDAAYLGTQFDVRTLAAGAPPEELGDSDVENLLDEAVAAGIIEPVDSAGTYQFVHDRVRESIAELVPPERRAGLHLSIGRRLHRSLADTDREKQIVLIADQLTLGSELIEDPAEREEVASLCVTAARVGRSLGAYDSSKELAQRGIRLLPPDPWTQSYDLALALHDELAESAYLAHDFDVCERSASQVEAHVHTLLDVIRTQDALIHARIAEQRLTEASATGVALLRRLGIRIPKKPGVSHMAVALLGAKLALRGRGPEQLAALPEMKNPKTLAALRIAMAVSALSFFTAPEIMPVLGLKIVGISARGGNSAYSAFAYVFYGMIVALLGNAKLAHGFGRFGLGLVDRFNAEYLRGTIETAFYALIDHRISPIRQSIDSLWHAYENSVATGNPEFAALALVNYAAYKLFSGTELDECERVTAECMAITERLKQKRHHSDMSVLRQCTANLLGKSKDPRHLEGDFFCETTDTEKLRQAGDLETLDEMFSLRAMIRLLLGDINGAMENAEEVAAHTKRRGDIGVYPVEHFYYALIFLAAAKDAKGKLRKRYLRQSKSFQSVIRKWAESGPANHMHKWHLIEAERYRVTGRPFEAGANYEKSISGARAGSYPHDEAIACELYAHYHLEHDREEIGRLYIHEAYKAYGRWGAVIKVRDLEQKYRWLSANAPDDSRHTVAQSSESGGRTTLSLMDLSMVIEAFKVVSGEILLDRLLEKMMRLVIQTAGGQSGVLVLEEEGRPVIVASGTVTGARVETTLERCSPIGETLTLSVVDHVRKTGMTIVLDDALKSEMFGDDPYIRDKNVRSLLCIPLRHQGQAKGLIYLENNLAAGVFNPARLEIITLVASQAAISLENASLYEKLRADIDALIRAEERLRESEATARTFLNALPDAAFLVTEGGTLLDYNEAFSCSFGSTLDLRGQLIWPLLGEDGAPVREIINRAFVTSASAHADHQSGDRWYHTVVYPVGSVSTPRATAIMFDVTEQRRADEQSEQHQRQLLHADKLASIGVLVASVVHEIGSPNQAIELGGRTLQQVIPDLVTSVVESSEDSNLVFGGLPLEELRKRLLDSVNGVVEGSSRIRSIIRELMDFARASELDVNESADANAVVNSAVSLLGSYLRRMTDRVEIQLADDLPSVRGQHQKLEQVIVNILRNACHALPGRNAGIRVSTAWRQAQNEITIEVCDEGVGMEPEVLARMTEPFFTTKPVSEGTGLGLSISRRILEQVGGEIRFASMPGRGTTVSVILKPFIAV